MKEKGLVRQTKENIRLNHFLESYYITGVESIKELESASENLESICNRDELLFYKEVLEDDMVVVDKVPIISLSHFASSVFTAITMTVSALLTIFIGLNRIYNEVEKDTTKQIDFFQSFVIDDFLHYLGAGITVIVVFGCLVFFIDNFRANQKKERIKKIRFLLRIVNKTLDIKELNNQHSKNKKELT